MFAKTAAGLALVALAAAGCGLGSGESPVDGGGLDSTVGGSDALADVSPGAEGGASGPDGAHDNGVTDGAPPMDAPPFDGSLPDAPITSCGSAGQACCDGGSPCNSGGCCVSGSCVANGGACMGMNVCAAGACAPCGAATQDCCAQRMCTGPNIVCDGTGHCQTCGATGEICCANNTCAGMGCCDTRAGQCVANGTDCQNGGLQRYTCTGQTCTACGYLIPYQICCAGNSCFPGLVCNGGMCQ